MNELVPIVLAFSISVGGAPAPAAAAVDSTATGAIVREDDRWIAEDKWKHFFLSFAATMLAYGTLRTAGLNDAAALPGAAAAAGGAGVWKELRDRELTGLFSVRDLVWDAAGIGVGLGVAVQTR